MYVYHYLLSLFLCYCVFIRLHVRFTTKICMEVKMFGCKHYKSDPGHMLPVILSTVTHRYVLLFSLYFTIFYRRGYISTLYDFCEIFTSCRGPHVMAETCRSNVYRRTSAMRFLYGPVKIEEGWKIRNNDELEEVMRGEDTVKFIRAQRIKLWVYLNSKIKK